MQSDRLSEWFVPKFGSRNFRLSIGILFLPYTGMVVSFAVWGSLSVEFSLDRLASTCLPYFLAVGISAHCLDALGSKNCTHVEIKKTKISIIFVNNHTKILVRYITSIPAAIPETMEALERPFSFSSRSHFIIITMT